MLFHIHEIFLAPPEQIYARFQTHGRLIPEGLEYVSSWVSDDLKHCFQVMETDRRELLDEWMKRWEDLVKFEVTMVVPSAEARARVVEMVGDGKEQEEQDRKDTEIGG